jgi:hypothetical protein
MCVFVLLFYELIGTCTKIQSQSDCIKPAKYAGCCCTMYGLGGRLTLSLVDKLWAGEKQMEINGLK